MMKYAFLSNVDVEKIILWRYRKVMWKYFVPIKQILKRQGFLLLRGNTWFSKTNDNDATPVTSQFTSSKV